MSNPLTLLKRYCLNQLPEHEFIIIRNSKDLYNFFENEGIGPRQIPGRKIFHSFLKTNSSFTILRTNYDPRGSVFHSLNKESEFYHKTQKCGGVLHMFSAEISGLMGLIFNANKYLGFCIFRKDGTVLDSLISKHIIIRENDTYAFLVPQVTKNIPILPGISRAITGFPYVEKDRKGIMCAQVSLAIIADYWNTKNSKLNFTASTAAEINQTVNLPNSNAGMSPKKMIDFFEIEDVNYKIVDVAKFGRETKENEYKPHVNIYGYLESKFPVLCGIETEDDPHAFVVIGHTFDRNDWMAIADLAYFEKPLSGEKGAYHSNLTWMRNFIIQDDNFGPYFFVPWEKLLDRLMMFVVPLPGDFDKTPLSAERQAFLAIQTMKMQYLKDYDKGSLLKDNEFWADRFLRNQYVLRPRFITSNELLKKYQGHSLQTKIAEFVANRNQDWYAEIEISWPDLYCYHRENIGCIIVDPYQTSTRPTFPLIHFPGVGYFSNKKGNIEKEIVGHPDGPRQHAIPSKKELI